MSAGKEIEQMNATELAVELKRLRDALADLEDTHAFTFGRTSVHIGAEMAQNMQVEYEEERKTYLKQIEAVERELGKRGAT